MIIPPYMQSDAMNIAPQIVAPNQTIDIDTDTPHTHTQKLFTLHYTAHSVH